MLFDLMESDQTGVTLFDTIDFPEITEEMYEDGEHDEILDDWLELKDMNSFSTSYYFQNARMEDPVDTLGFNELQVFYKFCVNKINYDLFKAMMLMKQNYVDSYIEEKWTEFRGDPIKFIVSRSDEDLVRMINYEIVESKYKG